MLSLAIKTLIPKEDKVKQDIVEWISKPENEDLLETLRLIK